MAKSFLFAALLLVISSALSVSAASKSPECSSVVYDMSSCLDYVKDGSNRTKPDAKCCASVESVVKVDTSCFCVGLEKATKSDYVLDMARAGALPEACNVVVDDLEDCPAPPKSLPPLPPPSQPSPTPAPPVSPAPAPTPAPPSQAPTPASPVSPSPAPGRSPSSGPSPAPVTSSGSPSPAPVTSSGTPSTAPVTSSGSPSPAPVPVLPLSVSQPSPSPAKVPPVGSPSEANAPSNSHVHSAAFGLSSSLKFSVGTVVVTVLALILGL